MTPGEHPQQQTGLGVGAVTVLPSAPVRQWVLSVPYELRWLLASKTAVLSAVIRIVMQVVLGWYRRRARDLGLGAAEAVSFVQRFGGSLTAHTHLHAILIDGVYTRDRPGDAPVFRFVPPTTHPEIEKLATAIGDRVCRMIRRGGLLWEATQRWPAPEPLPGLVAPRPRDQLRWTDTV